MRSVYALVVAGHRYTPLRHAYVGETTISGDHLLPIEWVMLARWNFDGADTHFCVEYLDASCEIAAEDDYFPTEQEAQQYAEDNFRLGDWREGVPRAASA